MCVCVCFVVCGILVPRSGIESGLLCSEIASLTTTAKEFPKRDFCLICFV